jgi:hypothetical protein
MKKLLNWIYTTIIPIGYRHQQYDIGVEDKSGWGFRCGVCEQKSGGFPVWHEKSRGNTKGIIAVLAAKNTQ